MLLDIFNILTFLLQVKLSNMVFDFQQCCCKHIKDANNGYAQPEAQRTPNLNEEVSKIIGQHNPLKLEHGNQIGVMVPIKNRTKYWSQLDIYIMVPRWLQKLVPIGSNIWSHDAEVVKFVKTSF